MTIAAMILVNDPGTWAAVYWPLDHAEWNGWTPTDLVFPFFLFIVGVSMVLSFASRLRRGDPRGKLALHVVLRSLAIFATGFFLNLLPHFHFTTVRIPGVLQRIGVCYLIAGLFVLLTARRADSGGFTVNVPAVVAALIAVLAGYWLLMRFVPVPGFGAGNLSMEGNLAAWLDRRLLSGHMWSELHQVRDPEGILSTIPAIGTALWGALVGEWIRAPRPQSQMLKWLAIAGVAALAVGRALHPIFPINKNLWTSTFVLFTSGFAMIVFALCYWLVDVKGWRRWAMPWIAFGTNAITAYVIADLLAIASIDFRFQFGAHRTTLHGFIYSHFFATIAQPYNASLLFAIFFVLVCFIPILFLYRRRIFIRL